MTRKGRIRHRTRPQAVADSSPSEAAAGRLFTVSAKGKVGTYEVGYKKPPKATRFKPGLSGNPKGRPRCAKS